MTPILELDPLSSHPPVDRVLEIDAITTQFSTQCALTVIQTTSLLRLLTQAYMAGAADANPSTDS